MHWIPTLIEWHISYVLLHQIVGQYTTIHCPRDTFTIKSRTIWETRNGIHYSQSYAIKRMKIDAIKGIWEIWNVILLSNRFWCSYQGSCLSPFLGMEAMHTHTPYIPRNRVYTQQYNVTDTSCLWCVCPIHTVVDEESSNALPSGARPYSIRQITHWLKLQFLRPYTCWCFICFWGLK